MIFRVSQNDQLVFELVTGNQTLRKSEAGGSFNSEGGMVQVSSHELVQRYLILALYGYHP